MTREREPSPFSREHLFPHPVGPRAFLTRVRARAKPCPVRARSVRTRGVLSGLPNTVRGSRRAPGLLEHSSQPRVSRRT